MKYVLYMKVISDKEIYEGWFFLNELSDCELFQEELILNEKIIWKLADTIVSVTREKRGYPVIDWSAFSEETQIEFIEIPPEKRIQIEKMEIVQYDNLNKLNLFNKIFKNSELDDFIKIFNQKNSQTVQTPAPVDPVPAAPVVVPVVAAADPAPAVAADSVPLGFVPAVIQGEFAEIQGSVRDSKRDSTLNATNRQTGVIKEGFGSVTETIQDGFGNLGRKFDRLIELTADNTQKISRETVENIEKKEGKDYRRFWQAEIQTPSMSSEEIWEWENPGRTLKGLNAEEKKQELAPIYTSLSKVRSKKRKP